ncbi:ATP-binding protein [Streptomyces sp. NBC_00576]|uniref:ATP-binding protein n=1 Tax=Streptomyces sp. NBC_00576 TaxID=2903665 RepID=UPI002E80EF65|nr:ATP-binding protein [Streptomyces sp. NBC_00576]WUB70355.1 ATP-binding protein [Streptomyces sp. NBC_00576]
MFVLTATPASVGTARRKVREVLGAWGVGPDTSDNALLVTSELVTNALTHAASERIVCRLHLSTGRLYIEVEDENRGGTLPAQRRPGPDEQCGRGLLLVGVLSSDWGVRDAPHGSGRVVWAELPTEQTEPAEAAAPAAPVASSVPVTASVPVETATPAGAKVFVATQASAAVSAPSGSAPDAADAPAPVGPVAAPVPTLPPTPPAAPVVQAAAAAPWHPSAPHRIRPVPHSAEGIASHGPYGTPVPHPPYSRS